MADISLFRSDFKQVDDVCLLASFGFAIEYYTRLQKKDFPDVFFRELFKSYVRYIVPKFDCVVVEQLKNKVVKYNTFREIKDGLIDVDSLSNGCLQCATSRLLHFYCQDYMSAKGINGYHGYHHLYDLYQDVRNNGKLGTVEIPTNLSLKYYENCPKNSMDVHSLKSFLSGEHCLALVFYPFNSNFGHSVLVFKSMDAYEFRDSNYTTISKEATGNKLFDNMNDIKEVLTIGIQ
jgi:hypothetical protein